ncbi:MAG TPA: type IV pilus assembly protein PilM, partial [Prosthecobacter sp.]|nr:type IV pilus assembly protein PilM [Prosthecobacter sp.]
MADSKSIAVLNLGSQRLSGAVFSRVGGDLVLKKYAIEEMSGDPTVDASRLPQIRLGVQELASKLRLKGAAAHYAVAGHTVFSRFVKLPPVQKDRVAQIVEFEAKQNVPFPINEVTWDYEIVSEGGGETEVILVAMKSETLNEINDQVAAAGMRTALVDLAPLALFNAFRYSYPDVDEPCVIIDLGARSTNMVFVEDGKFFTRNVLVGGASITAAIAKEFGIGFAEAERQKVMNGFVAQGGAVMEHEDPEIAALSKVIRNAATRLHGEVMRTINFYRTQQGGAAPQRVFICGGGALLGNMALFLEEKLKLPVEILNPLRGVQLDRSVGADAAAADSAFMGE